jgi:two-component system chemotaxis response regulator CheB
LNAVRQAPVLASPVDRQSKIELLAIAGSAGATRAMCQILSQLPPDFPAPILYLQHLNRSGLSHLAEVLQSCTALKVRWARDGDQLQGGVVYLCPTGSGLIVRPDRTLALPALQTERDRRCPADDFFSSAAASYGSGAGILVLSGAGVDGSQGVSAVHARHGTVLIQDEASAVVWGMPQAALATGSVDLVLPLEKIAPALTNLIRDGQPLATVEAHAAMLKITRVSLSAEVQYMLMRSLGTALTMQRTNLGNIQLVNTQTGTLGIVTQRGFGLEFLEHFRTVRLGDNSACGRAMRERGPVGIPDVTLDRLFAPHQEIARLSGFRAVLFIPVISRNGPLLGMLSTHFGSPRQFSVEEVQRLELHAQRAADIIEGTQEFPLSAPAYFS